MLPMLAIPLLPSLGFGELLLLGLFALLIFGKRLPEVGRSLGRGIVEFKKGLQGVEDDVRGSAADAARLENPPPQASIPQTQARQAATSTPSAAANTDKP